ncbi:MAG: pyruvate, water dikinase regulatory protein [Anaerolineales bacterium]|nr:kinase/pyrophosphorylase [Anaerolineales bacterium]MCS7248520.1 kinase/pyrophosphorylase [Anaerolineales bacterium]MDW8162333.1 pyruvate, water dikinase regulatory protein [Anaerolineales bacterium]MDW8447394.1 pyruvate, water dikinase regulatory protein [Anaerolineales bacterium]
MSMVHRIYTVSDASGATAERVVKAALLQFDAVNVEVIRIGEIRTKEQVCQIIAEAAANKGIIVHTLVSEELRHLMVTEGRAMDVVTIDIMGPLLVRLSDMFALKPKGIPGGMTPFDRGYLERIEAIDYTVRHDDGKNPHELHQAEIVLVGVSRTSKTPLSFYLAYRGWKVANVPIVLGIEPPKELFELPKHRVVGLTIRPERLAELRRSRVERLGTLPAGYADLSYIQQELAYAYEIFDRRRDWPLVDVSVKPIEETASEVLSLLGKSLQRFEVHE